MIYSSVYLHTFIYIYTVYLLTLVGSVFGWWLCLTASNHDMLGWRFIRMPVSSWGVQHSSTRLPIGRKPVTRTRRKVKIEDSSNTSTKRLIICILPCALLCVDTAVFFKGYAGYIYIYIVLAMWGKNDWTKPFIPPVFSVNWSETVRRHCLKQLEAKGKKDSEHY